MPLTEPSDSPFLPDPWQLYESGLDTAENHQAETLFALGNGTIGLRGTHEETYLGPSGSSHEGNYLNGFYESEPIDYPEVAYGLAKNNQFMLNLPNAKRIELCVGDERFNILNGKIGSYERKLDFRKGVLQRTVHWESPGGKQIIVTSERLVCFQRRHVFAIRYQITSVNFDGPIYLTSAIDMQASGPSASDDPRVSTQSSSQALDLLHSEASPEYAALELRTKISGFHLISAMSNEAPDWTASTDEHLAGNTALTKATPAVAQHFTSHIGVGQTRCLIKYGCYISSRNYPAHELNIHSKLMLHEARAVGFDTLCREQSSYLADFWQKSDVEIEGDTALQQGMRFNQFHLLQSVGRDGISNIAAKGLTGEGYEGHYFWDTEIYVLPFFLYSKPEIARQLLLYRFNGLDKARERARQMSHEKGALYPWRTIAGEECSAYFPAGTAQYHINADIAYAVQQYVEVTDDTEFLIRHGAEMVLETARIWMDLGHFSRDQGFCINEVTGPDEYTALVNNNYYTNAMAQQHLNFAVAIAARLGSEFPDDYRRIAAAIGLTAGETAEWGRAAQQMVLPYDAQLGIHAQDDSFLSKKLWDFAGTPQENYPLLLHYHPLVIYRHQVCKQADLMLAMMLLSDRFTLAEKKSNFDYYEKITTHDSSLSSCIFSIIASEIGYHEKAYAYFMETARMDLDDTHHNTCHGVHTAAMAGSWMCVTYGFAGMRVVDGLARFHPRLPKQWRYYQFRIQLHGALVEVRVEPDQTIYRLLDGAGVTLRHIDQEFQLSPGAPQFVAANLEIAVKQHYKAVIFDLDGVLTDTAHYHFLAWQQLAAGIGIALDETFNEQLKGVDRMGSLELILALSDTKYSTEQKQAMADAKNSHYLALIKNMSPADLMPGALTSLHSLREAGMLIGLASASRNALSVLDSLGIRDCFDVVVDSAKIKNGKPDPEIFLTAAHQLGVLPHECLGVEDSLAGISAIKAAGMRALGIGASHILTEADWVIADLAGFDLKGY